MSTETNTIMTMERSRKIVNTIVFATGLGLAIASVLPGFTDEFRHMLVANIAMALTLALVMKIVIELRDTTAKLQEENKS